MTRAEQVAETRARLLRAGERLFAEHGIHQVRLREINALAGQRNSSALHYHFGSREGLVEAILSEHQNAMDGDVRPALDALTAGPDEPTVRAGATQVVLLGRVSSPQLIPPRVVALLVLEYGPGFAAASTARTR